MTRLLASITVPIALTNDNGGRTQHWSKASSRKRSYTALVALQSRRVAPIGVPVALRLTRILGPRERLWDADSIGRGSAKELVDSLVECRWLHDDGPRWVTHVDYRQQIDRDVGPAVRIEFFSAEGE